MRVELIHRPDRAVSSIFRIRDPALIVPFDIFHRPDSLVDALLHSAQRSPLFSERFRVQPDDDSAARLDDESFPEKIESAFRLKDPRLVRHDQPEPLKMALYDQTRSFHLFCIVIEYQKIVIVSDIVFAYAFHIMIKLVQKRYLMQLVYLRSESCSALSECVLKDLPLRPFIL